MRPTRAVLLISLCSAAALASAAEHFDIRPGLWQTQSTLTFGGVPMYVGEMSAAQRAEYAKTWAQMVNKPQSSDDTDCITQKDIDEATLLKGLKQEDQACKDSNVKMTATTMTATVECKGDKTTTRTEVDYTASTPTAFKGSIKSTITSPNGTTTMTATMTAAFRSASCPKNRKDE